ncbi:hypothetical protein [Paenibacillus kobensis]|uniref:hypothetical protein n=1 Tax=Paenibacillus kobensis TaxID=59841 RepID=UPI000FDBE50D|nr:hypothetical protein [Paenibacillus kobensis]
MLRNKGNRIIPYNDLWLDCIKNNLISMLIAFDDSYKDIILHAGVKYHYKLQIQQFNYVGEEDKFYDEGFFTPKVMFSLDLLDQLVEKKSFTFRNNDSNHVDGFLKASLDEGYFIFLRVDRFFYPKGREAGKYHMEHPVFIYGYDDTQKCYQTIEDCMIPGTMDYFPLPVSAVQTSCRSFIESGKEIEVILCKPNDRSKGRLNKVTPLYEAIKMCKESLAEGEYGTEFNLLYYTGLKGLSIFATEFVELFARMVEPSLFKMRVMQFEQLHQRNINLVQYLARHDYIETTNANALCRQYHDLREKWGFFKRKSFEFIARRKLRNSSLLENRRDLQMLADHLFVIVQQEEDAVNSLQSICELFVQNKDRFEHG